MSVQEELLREGIDLREQGEHRQAVVKFQESLVEALKAKDWWGVAEANSHAAISYRIGYRLTGEIVYAIQALHLSRAAFEIWEEKREEAQGDKYQNAIRALHLASDEQTMGNHEKAVELFTTAATLQSKSAPEYFSMFQAHLAWARCMLGHASNQPHLIDQGVPMLDKSIDALDHALQENTSEFTPFQLSVWLTGALLNRAKMESIKNKREAKVILERARDLAEQYKAVARVEQAKKLLATLEEQDDIFYEEIVRR